MRGPAVAGLAAISLAVFAAAAGAEMTLVENGACRAPVVIPAGAPPATRAAAGDLADYLGKITGARPPVLEGAPEPVPESSLWVGIQPVLATLFPGLDLEFRHPEEILIAANDRHLVIAGRDRVFGDRQIEYGTANAVSTFLQDYLDVRWLWPGDDGEDLARRDTIAFAPFERRFHPPFRLRALAYSARIARRPAETARWFELQRTRGSLEVDFGHAYTDWWERYGADHPEYFAFSGPAGARTPYGPAHGVKLCVANPAVAERWLENAAAALNADPLRAMVSATPTDGGGWCLCDECRALDHPDGPPSTYAWGDGKIEHVMLTDRYARYWNTLARGLQARFPGREALVGVLAYARYKTPPVAATLAENITLGYVGHFPVRDEAGRAAEKQEWLAWAEQASMLLYRPNLFWYSGGPWGLPALATRNTAEDFRFLADNRCVGFFVDSAFLNWATAGPQLYLMAQLSWDPFRDGAALLEDYYRRAFGPAAGEIQRYYELLESAHAEFLAWDQFSPSGGLRYRATDKFPEIYNGELLARAGTLLDAAVAKIAAAPGIYRRRVALVRNGLDFIHIQVGVMPVMKRVRDSGGKDAVALREALEICRARAALYRAAEPFALDDSRIDYQARMRGMLDYLGPPSDELIRAGGLDPIEAWDQDHDAGGR